ncbi:hypothetical protein [Methylobacter sp. S3L5C]|uniref:hypothetical protein n=1 Tax=Methylobacter sp. S3L5C TaxID=2839024 RepID=UPI001FAD78F3|nr:hypothetical protein [Methylobacter sp. S3L5C]UOA07487.1 hypothetical protein KKZ03_14595 [Methylobacter sp. S3L5C]
MTEEKKPENGGLTTTIPVTVVLAILAGLIFTDSLPYQDERPSSHSLQTNYIAAQDVDARLWQDPFAAIDSASEEMKAEKIVIVANPNDKTLRQDAIKQVTRLSSHSLDQIYKGKKFVAGEEITILAVTLPGDSYQEAAEQRMRRRYAVLSALANQGVAPQDEQHIGYFHPDPDNGLQKKVAFEWWSQPDDKKQVLLIWVDESSLLGCPNSKLKKLLSQASQKIKQKDSVFNYAVIGPNTSTLLRDLLKEVMLDSNSTSVAECVNKPDAKTSDWHKLVYYSAGATASDYRLLKAVGIIPESLCKSVSDCLKSRDLTLYRTTATEHDMMAVLVAELGIRRVEKKDHVIVLSEWDTFYGRSMPDTFKNAWKSSEKDEQPVQAYGYMRGLDGKLPDKDDKTDSSADKKADNKDKSAINAQIELPEGQNQKDYLRRLADNLRDLDQYLIKTDANKKGIAAIGVLGSDVHDKLMILEALRQYFPHKLFFTTDLDAAYSHPAKWPQTHNLLVASGFDLKLRSELQGNIPSFRDSYQTAFFLATQLVLKNTNDSANPITIQPPARLFEIGRSHSLPLPTANDTPVLSADSFDDRGVKCAWNNWPACNNSVQPKLIAASLINFNLSGFYVTVMIAILLVLISWRVRETVAKIFKYSQLHPYSTTTSAILMLFLVYWLIPFWWNDYIIQQDAEPFYSLESTSAWPSQLLRLLACLFAIGFYRWGALRIKKMQNDLQIEGGDTRRTFALPDKPACLGNWEVLFVGSWRSEVNNKAMVFPDVLWKKYLGYCQQKRFSISSVWLRVLIHGFAFFAVAFLLVNQSGAPSEPMRGDFAMYVNKLMIFVTVFLTLFLTMWVVEHARLCEQLITHLSAKPSDWNENAKDWAIGDNNIAPECVRDWLDIQLVAILTTTIQPLIWGPMVCIGLLILARSPALDDWDIPSGLAIVLIAMLFYAISAELFLQKGAKLARIKSLDQLSAKIREQRNLESPNEIIIKRIEVEIERIRALRDGAFRPWYEWPLLQSFGGLGTLVFILQYFAGVWQNGTF